MSGPVMGQNGKSTVSISEGTESVFLQHIKDAGHPKMNKQLCYLECQLSKSRHDSPLSQFAVFLF